MLAVVSFMGCLSGWRGNGGEEEPADHHILGTALLHGIVAAGLSELKSSAGNALSVPTPPVRRGL